MPSRNMKEANARIFTSLDDYCSMRSEPLSNAGKARWISTTPSGRKFLKDAILIEDLSFSSSVKLARFDHSGNSVFVSVGFDIENPPSSLDSLDMDGGMLTAVLAELGPVPNSSPISIKNIVEYSDKVSDPNYDGHDPFSVASLYPKMQFFAINDLLVDDTFKIFFLLCLSDSRRVDQWIDEQLTATLTEIIQLDRSAVPYDTLCRSILDMDPAGLFLALYRCLEAVYAHSQTRKLMTSVGISKPWVEMALILEESLGWYPREEPSLEALLHHADDTDLEAVVAALGVTIPGGAQLVNFVAKKVYHLRNGRVHFRPFHQAVSLDGVDWNRLCEAMARLVFRIYAELSKTWTE